MQNSKVSAIDGINGRDNSYHGHFMSQYFNFVSQVPAFAVPSGFTASGLPTSIARPYEIKIKTAHIVSM